MTNEKDPDAPADIQYITLPDGSRDIDFDGDAPAFGSPAPMPSAKFMSFIDSIRIDPANGWYTSDHQSEEARKLGKTLQSGGQSRNWLLHRPLQAP